MKYSPKPENVRPMMLTVFLTVVAVMCVLFAGEAQRLRWLFQLLFVCFATGAIQILLKYVLTQYEYVCDGKALAVYKSMGKKQLLVAELVLERAATTLLTDKDFKNISADYDVEATYSFVRNLKADGVYVYLDDDGGRISAVKLELSEEFAAYLNEIIESETKGKQNDDVS